MLRSFAAKILISFLMPAAGALTIRGAGHSYLEGGGAIQGSRVLMDYVPRERGLS